MSDVADRGVVAAIIERWGLLPQVAVSYTPHGGYYPLGPWAGLAVECAWALAALILGGHLLRRRDA